jgi:hypothetical protein
MATKRLTLELPVDQYDFLRREADAGRTTISALIRTLIEESRLRLAKEAGRRATDSLSNRSGSFDGPADLAENHDHYLYGREKK